MKICRYCDVENPDDALFCRKCGKKFQKSRKKLANALKFILWVVIGIALGYGLTAGGFWVWDYFTQPTFIQIEGNTEYDVSVLPVENEIRLAVSTDADDFQTEFPEWISFSDEVSPADSVFFVVSANESDKERTGTIRLTAGKHTAEVIVSQPPIDDATSLTAEPGIDISMQTRGLQTHGVNSFIHNIMVEHNVYRDGKKGIVFHVDFEVENMNGKTGSCVCYFYDEAGTALNDSDKSHYTKDGKVSVGVDFTSDSGNCRFKDLQLFMPYSQFHLNAAGTYRLKCRIILWNDLLDKLSEYHWINIDYDQPTPHAYGKILNVWNESDFMPDSVAGMNVHVKLDVENMKGKTGFCQVHIYDPETGSRIKQVTGTQQFTPTYDSSTFGNMAVFVPNSFQFLGEGEHALKYRAVLIDDRGCELDKSDYYNFKLINY